MSALKSSLNQEKRCLFLRITTILTWLKSTLLLKNKCFDTHICMKTLCLQTNKTQHYCGKENAWGARWVRKGVALIKSLIYARKKRRAWGTFVRDRAEIVSWYFEPSLFGSLNLVANKISTLMPKVSFGLDTIYSEIVSALKFSTWITDPEFISASVNFNN